MRAGQAMVQTKCDQVLEASRTFTFQSMGDGWWDELSYLFTSG
jgi:hypothetical protein